MATMAKKRPDSKRSQGVDRHVKPRLAFHLDQDLLEAVERYVEVSSPRPTTTAVIVAAIEEFLAKRGHWPARPTSADEQK